jgi:protein-L-isoaspartate(D-aspartate) O-methyltransferase
MPHFKSFALRTAFCLCAAALELPSSGCAINDQDAGDSEESLRSARLHMVEEQLRARGIRDERVLRAMSEIPRHRFVPEVLRFSAYDDGPLPIGAGQTISQPYIVALMSENLSLEGNETVLEIGTGSGYQAAVLSRLAKQVYSIEIIPALANSARERLHALRITNVTVIVGDGNEGWAEGGPYEAIIVTAVAPEIPPALLAQLAEGGRMVLPVERGEEQYLLRLQKQGGKIREEDLGPVRFVPLVGGARKSDQP